MRQSPTLIAIFSPTLLILCLLLIISVVCCFSFCFAFLFFDRPLSALYLPPSPLPSLPPSPPPSHCRCHPPEAAPWCHSQGQRERGRANRSLRVRILGHAADLHDCAAASARRPRASLFTQGGKPRTLISRKKSEQSARTRVNNVSRSDAFKCCANLLSEASGESL